MDVEKIAGALTKAHERAWLVFCGLASILDGLLIVGSLGFYFPTFRQSASLEYARWQYRRKADAEFIDIPRGRETRQEVG